MDCSGQATPSLWAAPSSWSVTASAAKSEVCRLHSIVLWLFKIRLLSWLSVFSQWSAVLPHISRYSRVVSEFKSRRKLYKHRLFGRSSHGPCNWAVLISGDVSALCLATILDLPAPRSLFRRVILRSPVCTVFVLAIDSTGVICVALLYFFWSAALSVKQLSLLLFQLAFLLFLLLLLFTLPLRMWFKFKSLKVSLICQHNIKFLIHIL